MAHRPDHLEDELGFRQGAGVVSEEILRPRGRGATGISSERFGVNVRPQEGRLAPLVQTPGGRRFERQALSEQSFPFGTGVGQETSLLQNAQAGARGGVVPQEGLQTRPLGGDPRELELRSPLRPAPTIQGAEPPSLLLRDLDFRTFAGLGQGFNRLARFAVDLQAFNRDRGVSPGLGGTTPSAAGDLKLAAPGIQTKNLLAEQKNLISLDRDILDPEDPRKAEIAQRQSEITQELKTASFERKRRALIRSKKFKNATPPQQGKMLAEIRGSVR